MRVSSYRSGVADPITDGWNALMAGNALCLLGVMILVAMVILLLVILRIRKVHAEQSWAHNPDKTFKLRWRRG